MMSFVFLGKTTLAVKSFLQCTYNTLRSRDRLHPIQESQAKTIHVHQYPLRHLKRSAF